MGKAFNEMTRGEQYLELLRIEYEDQLRHSKYFRDSLVYSLTYYDHDPDEREQKEKEMKFLEMEMQYARHALQLRKGAENDKAVTEPENSESPTAKFTEITCTTV